MTGPPSNSTIIGPEITDLSTGETAGTPELRYILQREFLSRMSAMCAEEEVEFLDMVTPWLGINGFIDPALLRDSCHLHQECQEVYFELLDRFFGFVSLVLPSSTVMWLSH